MEQHSWCRNKNSEKDCKFHFGAVTVSQYSFGFAHGFVFCLVLKNICKSVGKNDLRCNGSFDKPVDFIPSSRLACVRQDQTSDPCTVIKQEAPDQQTGEQEAHAGLDFCSSDMITAASQELWSNDRKIENLLTGEKGSVSPFYLHSTGSDPGNDTHDGEEQLTDASDCRLPDVQEAQSLLLFEERKLRKRKQNSMSGVKETRKRKQARQADEAHNLMSQVATSKSSLKPTEKSNSKVSQEKTNFTKKQKSCHGNSSPHDIRRPVANSDTNASSNTAVVADVIDTVVPVTSKLFSCDRCDKTFTTERSCKRHTMKAHSRNGENTENHTGSGKIFYAQCDKCPKVYTGARAEKNLHQHILAYHSEVNPVQCDVCNVTLNNAHHLKLHKRSSHRKDVCYICGAHFVTQIGLQTHLLAHKGDKSYICEICGAAFVRVSSLRQHSKFHTDSRDFKCERCTLSFKTFPSLSIHMMCVHQCGSYFSSHVQKLAKLGYLIEKDSVERLQNCQCVTCGQKLVDSACPLHSSDCLLSFSCPQCQWTTKDIQKFRKHLVKRNSAMVCSGTEETKAVKKCGGSVDRNRPLVKNFVCASCGKQFYTQSHLQAHRHQHAEKRFACPVCNKSFTYKFNMQNHLTTHTDARPFECQICQKTFKMKSQLQLHQRYHDGEFKCKICGKVLTRKQHVINHYKLVHPESQKTK